MAATTAKHIGALGRIQGELTAEAMNGHDADAMAALCVEGITTFANLLGSLGGTEAPAKRKTRVVEDEDEAPRRGRPKGSKNKTSGNKSSGNKAKAKAPSTDDIDPDDFIAEVVAQALETGEPPSWGRGRPSELKIAARAAAEKALRKQRREQKANGGSKKKSGNKSGSKSGSKNKRKRTLPA